MVVAPAAPDFTFTLTPPSQVLKPAGATVFAVHLGALNELAAPVTLSVSGLPQGVTAGFSPAVVTPGVSLLTLTASAGAASGQAALTVSATGGGITHTTTGDLTVNFGLEPLCPGAYSGVVRDLATGQPLAGAAV